MSEQKKANRQASRQRRREKVAERAAQLAQADIEMKGSDVDEDMPGTTPALPASSASPAPKPEATAKPKFLGPLPPDVPHVPDEIDEWQIPESGARQPRKNQI